MRKLRAVFLCFVCLVALADETADAEIMKNMDFFSNMEVLEAAPMLEEFADVIEMADREKGKPGEKNENRSDN